MTGAYRLKAQAGQAAGEGGLQAGWRYAVAASSHIRVRDLPSRLEAFEKVVGHEAGLCGHEQHAALHKGGGPHCPQRPPHCQLCPALHPPHPCQPSH